MNKNLKTKGHLRFRLTRTNSFSFSLQQILNTVLFCDNLDMTNANTKQADTAATNKQGLSNEWANCDAPVLSVKANKPTRAKKAGKTEFIKPNTIRWTLSRSIRQHSLQSPVSPNLLRRSVLMGVGLRDLLTGPNYVRASNLVALSSIIFMCDLL